MAGPALTQLIGRYLSAYEVGLGRELIDEAKSADGGHLFDLLDIADVFDHSNPEVTKDCSIGPLENGNKERAARLFG